MTDVVQAKSLQERVGDRIKEQIGDLLTADDLRKMVDTAMHEAFFKERIVRQDGYGRNDTKPPVIVETVHGLLKTQVDEAIKGWMTEHSDDVKKIVDDCIGKGLHKILQDYADARAQQSLWSFAEALKNGMIPGYQRLG